MYIDPSYVTNSAYFEEVKNYLICTFCTGLIFDPIQCSKCQYNYCKECFEKWSEGNRTCPLRCEKPTFNQENRLVKNLLSKVILLCPAGCLQKFTYDEFLKHVSDCKSSSVNMFNYERMEREIEVLRKDNRQLVSNSKILTQKLYNINIAHAEEVKALKDKIKVLEQNIPNSKVEHKVNNVEPEQIKHAHHCACSSLPDVQVIVKECENYDWKYFPVCEVCQIAFPCPDCHNERDQSHECTYNKVLCNKCFSVNSRHNFKCVNDTCTNLIEISE
jgi:hypothetical protein